MDATLTFENANDQYWLELGIQTYNIIKTYDDISGFLHRRYGISHPITKKASHYFWNVPSILECLRCYEVDLLKMQTGDTSSHGMTVKKGDKTINLQSNQIFYSLEKYLGLKYVSQFVGMYNSSKLKKVTQYEKDILITFYNELLVFINRLLSNKKLAKNVAYGKEFKKEIAKLQKFHSKLSCVLDLELIQPPQQTNTAI
jgi:hypothetical protein